MDGRMDDCMDEYSGAVCKAENQPDKLRYFVHRGELNHKKVKAGPIASYSMYNSYILIDRYHIGLAFDTGDEDNVPENCLFLSSQLLCFRKKIFSQTICHQFLKLR